MKNQRNHVRLFGNAISALAALIIKVTLLLSPAGLACAQAARPSWNHAGSPKTAPDYFGTKLFLRGDDDWLRTNVLYEMAGGQRQFDEFFEIKNGQVVQRKGEDISKPNAGIQELAELANATENYIYFAGRVGPQAAALFTDKNQQFLARTFTDTRQEIMGGRMLEVRGYGMLVGTSNRDGNPQPANLANGDQVFAVIAYNTNTLMTQESVDCLYGDETEVLRRGCSAPEYPVQCSGVGQRVRPVSFFIHESDEKLQFARQGRGNYNYLRAHVHAIHREAAIRQALDIDGGFAGGVVYSRIPRKREK